MRSIPRLELFSAYFDSKKNFQISFYEVVAGSLKLPSTWIGPRYIKEVIIQENYKIVYIKGCKLPLYWPLSLPNFDLTKVVTESFYPSDWHFYETPETTVQSGDVVFDCGAAEGIFSLRVHDRAKKLVAFEPLPVFTESLEKTFSTCPHVTVVSSALSDKEGHAFLEGGSLYGNITDKKTATPIQVTTIDKWASSNDCRVDFIKGDLEGAELAVLRGAQDTIRRFRPKIAFTVYHPGNDWNQMVSFIQSLVPEYKFCLKGISYNKNVARPVMMHLWC